MFFSNVSSARRRESCLLMLGRVFEFYKQMILPTGEIAYSAVISESRHCQSTDNEGAWVRTFSDISALAHLHHIEGSRVLAQRAILATRPAIETLTSAEIVGMIQAASAAGATAPPTPSLVLEGGVSPFLKSHSEPGLSILSTHLLDRSRC